MRRIFILCFLLLAGEYAFGQACEDMAVELSATTQVSPPKITLNWKKVAYGSPTYTIYKKAKTATSWGAPLATLTATDSTYTDAAVIADSAYEYQVLANGAITSSGYIYAGIKSPAMHNKGTLLLMVDSFFTVPCAAGIKRLMNDISGDGWQVIRHDMNRSKPDTAVKAVIANDYALHTDVKAVLILGHLAVPYSSLFNVSVNPPDGHVPQHDGAWPADVFYGCMTGWTDVAPADTSGSYAANWNRPGDGKYDQYTIPSPVVLQVSRVDFNNMPAFTATEVQLMNSYLDRDHAYKMDSLNMVHRGLINDNFGYFSGEAFAANGWRNFAPLVRRDSVHALPFICTLASSSYQWSYGCGPGSFTTGGGIGATSDFASNPFNGIFTMMFGSYFGDWNVQNNFLRAPLCASTPALANCWAGRPNWFFHHMALGENIGYSTMLAQNNDGLIYQPGNFGLQYIDVALMGDLTLRTDYIKPVTNLTISAPSHNGAILNWTASPDPGVIGYYVYRTDSAYGHFQKISGLLTALTFHDIVGSNGLKYYMVRPVKLQSTPSGGYYNLGIGVTDSATVTYAGTLQLATVTPTLSVSVFPNPATSYINVSVGATSAAVCNLYIINEEGKQFDLVTKPLKNGDNTFRLNVGSYAAGIYSVVIRTGDQEVVTKWVKL